MTLNDSSTDKAKLSISQRLGTLYAIAYGMENEGVSITTAQVSNASSNYILVFAHDRESLMAWMKKRALTPEFRKLEPDEGLVWEVQTEFLGVQVVGYLTDDEKEEWDHALDSGDPA